MIKNNKNPRYSILFKKNALDMLLNCGHSVHKTANLVGVGVGTLYRWKSQQEIENIKIDSINDKKDISEIIQLRQKNKKLTKENRILKNTILIFSENQNIWE